MQKSGRFLVQCAFSTLKTSLSVGRSQFDLPIFFYYIGNCAQKVRIFACKIKVYLFNPLSWGNEGVDVLKTLCYFGHKLQIEKGKKM